MANERISVIIVLYFSRHLLEDILLNVKLKVRDLGEIILINNSQENLDDFQSENISIIYPKENLGYGVAINLGVKLSRYEYILILNPDLKIEKFDVVIGDAMEKIILSGDNPAMPGYSPKFPTIFTSYIEHGLMAITYVEVIDRMLQRKKMPRNTQDVLVDYVSGALIFTNKCTFDAIGGFDDSFFLFYEETDFCKRAEQLRIPVMVTSRIAYTTKAGKSSSINVNDIKVKAGINSCRRYHTKYDGPFLTKCFFAILKLQYAILIVLIGPFSLVSQKLRDKRKGFIFRMQLF